MSGSQQLLELKVTIGCTSVQGLVDSGSMYNFVDAQTMNAAGLKASKYEKLEIVLADQSKIVTDRLCMVPVYFTTQIY